MVMKSEEIIYQKAYVSPRPPLKIPYKDNWMCDLDSDIAGYPIIKYIETCY